MEDSTQKSVLKDSTQEPVPKDSTQEPVPVDSKQKSSTKHELGPVWKGEVKEDDKEGSYLEVSKDRYSLFTFVFHRYKVLDTKEEYLSINVYQHK